MTQKRMNSENYAQPINQQTAPEPASQISHLERRKIQAPVAECLINGFAAVLGREKAIEIATEAIRADAIAAGQQMAKMFGDNGIKTLGRVVREVWAEGDALTIEFGEETEQTFSFNVTHCRYAEFYEQTGRKDLGYCLSCSRDEAFIQGFNPLIRLSRTQTIMQGATMCDFRFTLAEDKEKIAEIKP